MAQETHVFRGSTVEEALADATTEIGRDVEILEANRIRRGGVGGFFATDLGVEIVVAPVSAHTASHERLGVPDRAMPEHYSAPATGRHVRAVQPSTAAAAETEPRPQFYDRVIEERDEPEVPTTPTVRPARRDPRLVGATHSAPTAPAEAPRNPARPRRVPAADAGPARDDRSAVALADEPVVLDEVAADRRPIDSVTAQIDSESFASHFARQMAADPTGVDDDTVRELLRAADDESVRELLERAEAAVSARSAPESTILADDVSEPESDHVLAPARPMAVDAEERPDAHDATAVDEHAQIPSTTRDRPRTIRTTVKRARRSTAPAPAPIDQARAPIDPAPVAIEEAAPRALSDAAPTAQLDREAAEAVKDQALAASIAATADEPVPAADPVADKPAKRSRSGRRDPLRRPTEVVATAVNALVEQLSETTPVEGSRLNDLRSLRVRLTTSDGDTIEMTAKLGDD